jgi:hypothetical protein
MDHRFNSDLLVIESFLSRFCSGFRSIESSAASPGKPYHGRSSPEVRAAAHDDVALPASRLSTPQKIETRPSLPRVRKPIND